ncbi:hypothetical protein FQN54_000743 [Arachnomyces sp. PD_36]|nr:hypothetical protein FQN54_000743 [Arachnomyces sp. PD_36]
MATYQSANPPNELMFRAIMDWGQENAMHIHEACRLKGGWEGWTQEEMRFLFQAGREDRCYQNSEQMAADIVLTPESSGREAFAFPYVEGECVIVELKCESYFNALQFKSEVARDIRKVNNGVIKPRLRQGGCNVYCIGLSTSNQGACDMEDLGMERFEMQESAAPFELWWYLRTPCVELSSVALKFRARQATPKAVQQALESLHGTLKDVASQDGLDEKLAEYAFFPLTHVFNETQRVSARCLEIAARCLEILVEKGWRTNLSPAMGKQLLILMTILAGGSPSQTQAQGSSKPQSEELVAAAFDCLSAVFLVLGGPVAAETIYNEIGSTTVVDQTVYVLLEGITDGDSDEIRLAAVTALRRLYSHITSRIVLASLMPRTVSALTKTLRPTTQIRRSYKLLQTCINLLTEILKAVLNDADTFAAIDQGKQSKAVPAKDGLVLDESWLKATSAQVKLALANVVPLRSHDRAEVREALLELCLLVIEQCPKSLSDSMTIMVETIVALSQLDDNGRPNKAYTALRHLSVSDTAVSDILKSSLHTWVVALPRVMPGNDDGAKQRAMKQISTAFSILSQTQAVSGILEDTMTSSLCDSVAAAIHLPSSSLQPVNSTETRLDLDILRGGGGYQAFQPVLLDHRSQTRTLKELQFMISSLDSTESSLTMTRSLLGRLHGASGNSLVAPLWLTLKFLGGDGRSLSFNDMLSTTESSSFPSTRSVLIEELYSISLPILTDQSTNSDWRLQALALEVVALQAKQLGESFQPELIDALYPVLQFLGSNNPNIRHHAMTCLNILTTACNYADTSSMLVGNVDYLVNSVGLKLNTFDVSPQAPQVLLMMVRLCGASLIPYLDDLVGSIFAVLDSFHGYPKLVELLFSALGAIVDEGAKEPGMLAITDGNEQKLPAPKQRIKPRSVAEIAKRFAERKAREDEVRIADEEALKSHPKRPWNTTLDGPEQPKEEDADSNGPDLAEESEEPLPPTQDPEDSKVLSKPHTLLLHIAESIPPHLSSPSPFLRRSLLTILTRALPTLAHHENSFLPLINNIWHSVSSRITLPPSLASDSVSLVITGPPSGPKPEDSNKTETGIKEETFVIVAACDVLETMCKGAGDFMTSRLEHEFPRLKRIYKRVWEMVQKDADKITTRMKRRQRILEAETTPQEENTASKETAFLHAELNRIFTSHHTIWKSLVSLFTTMLTYVRLPHNVADEICTLMAIWIVSLYPNQYDAYNRNLNLNLNYASTDDNKKAAEEEVDPPISNAIQAMEVWNPDLTWLLFEEGLARRDAAEGRKRRRLETPRVPEDYLESARGRISGEREFRERWAFAEMVF